MKQLIFLIFLIAWDRNIDTILFFSFFHIKSTPGRIRTDGCASMGQSASGLFQEIMRFKWLL